LGNSSSPAPAIDTSSSARGNVIALPVPPLAAAREHCCICEEDPLGAPELVPHALGICELAFSIASAVVGQECCRTANEADEARHERVYALALQRLCQMTSQLVGDLCALQAPRVVRPRVD
jgi:hypothetical protein